MAMGSIFMNGYEVDDDKNSMKSVMMFPWLAHGHISPFLELGKKLSQRNFTVYLCSTSANLHSVSQKLSPKFSRSINLVELKLPSWPNGSYLPPHYHTTNGLPPHLMNSLKKAFSNAASNFASILTTLKPDLLIFDSLQPWAASAASALGIPAVDFITTSATMTSVMFHAFKNQGGVDFPFSNIYDHHDDCEDQNLKRMLGGATPNDRKDFSSVMGCIERSSDIVLIKGFKEIEGKYSDYLSKMSGKKILPVGPLVQEPALDDRKSQVIAWLDKKQKGSTVFVCFGSEYFLTQEEREEIAQGLLLSKANFVWAIRFAKGEKMKLKEALPVGFLKKVGRRGIVVEGWAPQAKILEHPSVGGFVSHCGWSSVMESMKYGVPIIAMPMHLDQPINARLVEEVGMGREVARDKAGRPKKENIAALIDGILLGKSEGFAMFRRNASAMRDKIRAKGDQEIDLIVEELGKLCMKYKLIAVAS